MTKTVDMNYEETIEKVTEELKNVGFGILTTIDVKETFKKKLDKEFKKYMILGACNPNLAYSALNSEIELGLLLPCNVIVYEDSGNKTVLSILNPELMVNVAKDSEALKEISSKAKELLSEVLSRV